MPSEITLQFTGKFSPANRISARTLAHTLAHLQRSIDKIVIFERRGSLRKYGQLASSEYESADLIVLPFVPGSIKIPLINEATAYIASRLRGFLEAPYQLAAAELDQLEEPLRTQVPAAINRASNKDPLIFNQQYLIDHPEITDTDYAQYAVLNDINHLLSPLRSNAITDTDTISMHIRDQDHSRSYEFNKDISTRFGKIIGTRSLGVEVIFTGKLIGLEAAKRGGFPYSGKLISEITGKEMKLWIPTEADALTLNQHNLSSEPFSFWGAPISQYGTYDAIRGDIVFLRFAQ